MILVDYHVHSLGHLDLPPAVEVVEAFVRTAIQRGVSEIGFADHDRYWEVLRPGLFDQVQAMHPSIRIRKGLEVQYTPEGEAELRRFLSTVSLDYVIGSVHSIGQWDFDDARQISEYAKWDTDRLYRVYYSILSRAASCGLFDVVGHLDVIKVFGYRPPGPSAPYAEAALTAIRDAGLCFEINTNGKYKPVQEAYPEKAILDRCFSLGVPVTFGSDAHAPENAGRDIEAVAKMARQAGYLKIATFERRRRVLRDLAL